MSPLPTPAFTRRAALGGAALSIAGCWLRSAAAGPADPAALANPDPRIRFAAWAIQAPNSHNRQPWLIRLDKDGGPNSGLTLFCDLDRRLPVTDPFDRQILISLGCFVELFRITAAEEKTGVEITMFPDGEPQPRLDRRPIARLVLTPGTATADPLFAAAGARRSTKQPFDTTNPPTPAELAQLRASLIAPDTFGATSDPGMTARLRDITIEAGKAESLTPRTHQETVDLIRLGRAEITAYPDGVALGGPMIEELLAKGLLKLTDLTDPSSNAFQMMLKLQVDTALATPAYVWTITKGNSRKTQLMAGRDWLRLNLAATQLGLGFHPMSQCLQEFPEMAKSYADIRTALNVQSDQTVQLLARLGRTVGQTVRSALRWPVESRIMRG